MIKKPSSHDRRQLVIGIDEAGYGPNLGPLVIGCSSWLIEDRQPEVSDSTTAVERLLEQLAPIFRPRADRGMFKHIPLGDSKALYSSGDSLDSLAVGVRYWLNSIACDAVNFQNFFASVAIDDVTRLASIPWYRPIGYSDSSIERFKPLDQCLPTMLIDEADLCCQRAGVRFLGLTARIIDEGEFNSAIARLGNKATFLSNTSLRLAAAALELHSDLLADDDISIHVYCDKHGGRNRYQSILMDAMPDLWFDVLRESALRSDYVARWQERTLRWSFLAKGDRLIASALSSMVAKWLREGLMHRLNQFWRTHLPGLKQTAGYPMDAKRFRQAIETTADRLGYLSHQWWRNK
ncbi:MAG: hypothetical protein SGI77_23480 [Pirellulaceae bacterium]|nr:hypothetical protein [Pirellulaceae bacterium]